MPALALPPHRARTLQAAELGTCMNCQTPRMARWSFYATGYGRMQACHDCFMIKRDPDDQYAELNVLAHEDQEDVEAQLADEMPRIHEVSDVDVLIYEIEQGLFDEAGLDRLLTVVQSRVDMRSKAMALMLKRGDRVKLVAPVRPTYLAGVEGTVAVINGMNVMVVLDKAVGRYRANVEIRVPFTYVRPIAAAAEVAS